MLCRVAHPSQQNLYIGYNICGSHSFTAYKSYMRRTIPFPPHIYMCVDCR